MSDTKTESTATATAVSPPPSTPSNPSNASNASNSSTASTASNASNASSTPSTSTSSMEAPVSARWQLLRAIVVRVMPFVSLAIAAVSAVFSSRSPEKAPRILLFALGGWLFATLLAVAMRRVVDDGSRRSRVVRFAALFASQYLIQASLAFPIPFFVRALSPVVGHVVFAAVYVVVAVFCFWDPLFAWLAQRPWLLVIAQAFSAFVALLTVLPVLGLDNDTTFVAAAVVVAVAAPVGAGISAGTLTRRGSLAGASALALGILVFVGAPLVPAVPLSLAQMSFARDVDDRVPVGVDDDFDAGEVYCFTAVAAPLGLRDQLVHVWLSARAGEWREVQRVPLDVRGGRAAGFRTWSKLSRPPAGRLRCRLETPRGQVLGVVDAVVRDAHPEGAR